MSYKTEQEEFWATEFGNDSNIFLLASGHEDSIKAFALEIKPLLESFEKWISSSCSKNHNTSFFKMTNCFSTNERF